MGLDQTQIRGSVPHGTNDADEPVKVGGVARQTNPAAVRDGTRVNAAFDDLGRQVMWPYQVRDLISTGSATLTRAQETAVIAAVAAAFVDVVTITGANTSGAAIRVDIRSGTGNGVMDTLVIPATNVISKTYHVPLVANNLAAPWTAQVNDAGEISDSPVTITMIGVQNV